MSDKTRDFLQKLKDKGYYNEDYDYSKVEYINATEYFYLECKIHGKFKTNANKLLNGRGCKQCGIIKRNNEKIKKYKKIFIDKAEKIHGKKYDYSLVEYKKARVKIKIVCPIHGVFEQVASTHLSGSGCPLCSHKIIGEKQQKPIEQFIKESNKQHKNKYDYSLVEYNGAHNKVKIICPIHGVFEQTPSKHINRQGCKWCSNHIELTKEDFFKISTQKYKNHNFKDVVYINQQTEVIIYDEYGYKYNVKPTNYLKSGLTSYSLLDKNKKFIKESNKQHKNKYDYSLVEYNGTEIKVKIICPIHGVFEQTPYNHLQGKGCPICNHGWSNQYKLNLINQLSNDELLHLSPIELQTIIAQGNIHKDFEQLIFTEPDSDDRKDSINELREKFGDEEEIVETEDNEIISNETDEEILQEDIDDLDIVDKQEEINTLPELNGLSDLDSLDIEQFNIGMMDKEAIDFLIEFKLRNLWNRTLNETSFLSELKNKTGGKYFTQIKKLFFEEYDSIVDYVPPTGYDSWSPNLMQKLTVHRLLKNKRYGNWSGTGAGKTLSFIIASREIDSKLTVVASFNSTKEQLGEEIKKAYPNSKIHLKHKKGTVYNQNEHHYLIFNYEFFQQDYAEELLQDLNKNNIVDFIVIDEIQSVKQRKDDNESKRRSSMLRLIGRSQVNNENLYVLGMSATPVINNLFEAKSLLEMISGEEHSNLNTRYSIPNGIEMFKQLTLNGLRYKPTDVTKVHTLTGENIDRLKIDGKDLIEKLLLLKNKDISQIERLFIPKKMESIKSDLKPGVILYTNYTTGIIGQITKYLKENTKFTYATFTGEEEISERNLNLKRFINGEIDILIGSRPIGTGVDGLQKISDTMILLTLPWTDAEYKQLTGRINRQGSVFKNSYFIIPQVFIDMEEEQDWSWDLKRWRLIERKKTISDVAVDGVLPSKTLPSKNTMYKKSMESLIKWKERLDNNDIVDFVRNNLRLPLLPEIVEYQKNRLGDFSQLNKEWSIKNSNTTFDRLSNDKSEWYYYHDEYRKKRENWSEIPYIEISKMINYEEDIVGDFGCGENLLRKEIKNKVYSFDYVGIDDSVIECDISDTKQKSNILDVAVFSLSLMGTNWKDYISEAHRLLKRKGEIIICEPKQKRTIDGLSDNVLEDTLKEKGYEIIYNTTISNQFIYIRGIKM